jgi:hypothetical protein
MLDVGCWMAHQPVSILHQPVSILHSSQKKSGWFMLPSMSVHTRCRGLNPTLQCRPSSAAQPTYTKEAAGNNIKSTCCSVIGLRKAYFSTHGLAMEGVLNLGSLAVAAGGSTAGMLTTSELAWVANAYTYYSCLLYPRSLLVQPMHRWQCGLYLVFNLNTSSLICSWLLHQHLHA